MKSNCIFLTEEDLDISIYRIFSFDRLRQIFSEKKLTLVKPKLWDDPFENFILNAEGQMPDGRVFSFGARELFYGQCWTLARENDAMWRIYSPEKDGVKVKTTIRKLFKPLFDKGGHLTKTNGDIYNHSAFIGKVKYETTKVLLEMLNDETRMSSKVYDKSGWGQASTFYFKRIAFKHEREVRIMWFERENSNSDFFKFEIEPNELFDQIVFDPQMKKSVYKRQKEELKSWGYDKSVFQSGLYKVPKLKIKVSAL